MSASGATFQVWMRKFLNNSVLCANSTVPAYEAARLMENLNSSAILVLKDQIPVGIVTNKDLTEKIIAHSYPLDTPIRRIMSSPLISISPETELRDAAELMASKKIRKLPIIRENSVVGMVVASDVSMNVPNPS